MRALVILCHRWMGRVFCLLFTWWFVTGIQMMYSEFPEVRPADRLARSPALDSHRIRLSPSDAYLRSKLTAPPSAVQLTVFDGRPVFRFTAGRTRGLVFADEGETPATFP